MSTPRGTGTRAILLAACMGLAATAHAACNGPQAMVAQLRAHPTTDKAVALGSWYAGHGQFDCAIDVFRGGIQHDPNSAQLHYLAGLAMLGAKRPADAEAEIKESTRLQPEVLKPHLLLATLYDDAGRRNEAETQWKAALKIDPKSEQALDGLSAELFAREDYVGVVQLLRDAPRTETLTVRLSQALGKLNYVDEAGAVLLQAMQAKPDSMALANAMVVVLVKQVKHQEAINLMEHMVKVHPGDMDAKQQLFRLLVLTNHINQARPLGTELLSARPHDPEVLYLNGIVQRMMGNYAEAKVYLEQAVTLEPDFFNSRYNLGMVLVFLKEWQEAKDNLQKAILLGAPQPEVHFELAKALRGLGDMPAAQAEMKRYQDLKHADDAATAASVSAGQGDADLEAGKIDEAIHQYRDAIEAKPDSAGYHFKLAMALARSGDTKGQTDELQKTVQLDAKLAGAQNSLGVVLARTGDVEGAIAHFHAAVIAAPGWSEAWINLAAELAVGQHYADARSAVAKALEIDPENAQAKELRDQLARDPNAQQSRP